MITVRPVNTPSSAALHRPQPVDPDQPWLDPKVIAERIQEGRAAEFSHGELPPGVIARGKPGYFRTYTELKDAMFGLAAKYPALVTVKNLGPSSEKVAGIADRDILALTLTNKATTGLKPVVEHTAGMHAREIANPELLMQFAEQLASGYGRNPDATSILDTREIDLIPMMNPDGHAVVERAYDGQRGGDLMQRKNTSAPAGTDLNRNFDFHWGGAGASSNPRSDTYRGPSPASEAEIQALQKFTAERKPAMYTDWHSHSRLNLYPWGDTRDKAKDYEGLKAVAVKMSTMNQYSPIQAVDLYPTTGTSDDWVYGATNGPAWAVETGRSFHQSDAEFATTLRENIPVLWYHAKIADKPFERAKGPDVTDVNIDPTTLRVHASASELTSGKNKIARAEIVLDPNAAPGSGFALKPVEGTFDSPTETLTAELDRSKLPRRMMKYGAGQLVHVRAQDDQGNWGPTTAQWLNGAPEAPKVRRAKAPVKANALR